MGALGIKQWDGLHITYTWSNYKPKIGVSEDEVDSYRDIQIKNQTVNASEFLRCLARLEQLLLQRSLCHGMFPSLHQFVGPIAFHNWIECTFGLPVRQELVQILVNTTG